MTKWTLVGAAVVIVVGFMAVPAPAQEVVQSTPRVIASGETITTAPRSGLLSRLRNRRGTTSPITVSQPITQAKTMPGATPSTVQQAQATETTAMPVQTQATESRQGLLARLRGRLGR